MALNTWKVISKSFDDDWKCLRCGQHGSRPAFKIRGEADSSCSVQMVVLADQSFPAVLPSAMNENCIKILLIENGSLYDLVNEFIRKIGNRRVPPGTTILMFSASHLGMVGTAAYAEDYLEAEKMLKEKFGPLTRVGPLPPVMLGGCDNEALIRSIYELGFWLEDYFTTEPAYLEETHVAALYKLDELGEGMLEPEERRIRLPVKTPTAAKKIWSSGGKDSRAMPSKIRPLTSEDEKNLISQLITELRVKLALDLDPNPTYERGLGLQSRARVRVDYLIIGSSHARKLRDALDEKGRSCSLVYLPNWRIGRGCAEDLLRLIKEAYKSGEPENVVIQILDNSCYYARAPDGSIQLAKKGEDGVFHMEGEVQVLSREIQYEHFEAIKPLVDIFEKKKVFFITPLPRYVVAGCCSNEDHCVNRREPGYKNRIQQGLEDIRRNLKDFLFHKGKRNVKVLDPNLEIRGLSEGEVWDMDPIHPREEVYKKIAEGLINVVATATENNKRPRSDSWGTEAVDRTRGGAPYPAWAHERGRGRGWERGRPP
jgi:hypothetical protein